MTSPKCIGVRLEIVSAALGSRKQLGRPAGGWGVTLSECIGVRVLKFTGVLICTMPGWLRDLEW